MAAFDFPNSPSTNDTYTANGVTFKWNGTIWQRISASTGAQGSTGPSGPTGAQGAAAGLTISTSAPGSPSAGDMWWDSDSGLFLTYYNDGNSSQWVELNQGPKGAQGATGAQGAAGAQGATGPTGAQGAAGAQGATGTAGSNASISNNADNRVITGGSGTNLNGESTLNYGSGHQLTFSGSATPLSGTSLPYSVNIYRDGGSGYGYFDTMTNSSYSTGVRIRTYNNTTYNNVIEHTTSKVTNFQTNGLTRLSITSTGNIGVAGDTGTDYSLLDGMVINTANGSAGLIINSSSSSHNAYMSFGYGSGSGTSHADQYSAYIGRVGDNKLIFGTNNNIRSIIDSNGNMLYNSNATGGSTFYSSSYNGSIQIHDSSLILSKVGTGTRNWRFVNNNLAAGNFGIQCSTSDNGGTSYSNVVEFNKNGNVCVGNGNPTTARLEVRDSSANNYGTSIRLSQGYNSAFSEIASNFGGSMTLNAGQGGGTPIMHFQVNDSEKMRLDNNSRFYFMTTSQGPHGGKFNIDGTDENLNTLNVKGNSVNYVVISSSSRNGGHHIYFSNRQSGSNVNTGTIQDNNSNVSYNTSSDYRIKENVVSISDGITRLKQLNPVRHTFKNNSTAGTVDGWIAHELDTVCPYAVIGEKDAVNEDGTPDLQGVDYGRVTPLIVAALKEAVAKIETLESKVAALEGA